MNKYEVLGVVGEGAYGVVIKCRNKENNEIIAIKKFKDSDDDEIIRKNTQREIKALKFLKHENIVDLKEAFKRKGRIHLVFEYVEKNLLEVLEKTPHGLEPEYIKKIIYQLVKAIDFCHSKEIVHRDIKPENLLVNKKSILKLCDFGFARHLPTNAKEIMTDYVATRWYRAPELLLSQLYGKPVDMWSIACIMAELIDGQPLFPGENEIDQLALIQKIIDPLTFEQKEAFNRHARFKGLKFKEVKKVDSLEKKYLGKISKRGMAFMKAILKMDPKERLSCKQALEHPYFEDLREADKNNMNDPGKRDSLEGVAKIYEGNFKIIKEERANLDKQKRDERIYDNVNKENEVDRKTEVINQQQPVKMPSFISDTKFMHKSVYNFKLEDDKKLEEIFPYANQYTNKTENHKVISLIQPKENELPFNPATTQRQNNEIDYNKHFLKSKGVGNWLKTKNKKIENIISNHNSIVVTKDYPIKSISYNSNILNHDFYSDYALLNEYDNNFKKENNFLQGINIKNIKSHLPFLQKVHGKSEEKTKPNPLSFTNAKFNMQDQNYMKMKAPFSNSDVNNMKSIRTDASGKKLENIKTIYNNTFNVLAGNMRNNVYGSKEVKKKIK